MSGWRRAARVVGLVLLAAAAVAFVAELLRAWGAGSWRPLPLGEIWSAIDTNSYVGFGAFIEKRVSPTLWTEVLLPVLTARAWIVLGLPGAVLLALGWRHRRRRRHTFRR